MSTPRSRKSSVNSHRPPASLRIPSAARRASNTALSFVFAQGDPARSHALSEAHLSRQLDGDLGGKQMGLRSRRSSSATVRTMRTVSGLRSPSSDHRSLMEEEENQGEPSRGRNTASPEPIADLSPQLIDDPSASTSHRNPSPAPTINKRSLNPKSSSSWLRWASPTPSFPRSPSVSKGKAKEKERFDDTDSIRVALLPAPLETDSVSRSSSPPTLIDEPHNSCDPSPNPLPDPSDLLSSIPTALPDPPTISRGWWGRATPRNSVEPKSFLNDSKVSTNPTDAVKILTTSSHPPNQTAGEDLSDVLPHIPTMASHSFSPSQTNNAILVADPSNQEALAEGLPQESNDQTATTSSRKGWKGYLSWSSDGTREKVKTIEPAAPLPPDNDHAVNELSFTDDAHDTPVTTAEPLTNTAISPDHPSLPHTAPSNQATQPQPWSTYFYSFVVPPPRPAEHTSQPAPSHVVETGDPTEEQRPVHNQPAPDPSVEEATPISSSELPTQAAIPFNAAPQRNPDRRPSTNGWLDYLAFRAGQKNVDGGSVYTVDNGRNTSEAPGEEVMDFSADPEFPSSANSHNLAPPQLSKNKEVKVAAEAVKTVTPKPSQTMDVRKKRLSNASVLSNGSLTPALASPNTRSSLEGNRPGLAHQNGSSLPPPPQQPSVQPNLVIPTFRDTFDRPPRSFLPVPVPTQTPEPPNKGITAATTGLAWKALGAVGSYVYGGAEIAQKTTSETLTEDECEVRGRKEGRNVGSDMPRRIGLGSGTPDDGWRDVRRVVVIGVHGWFPAKMLNSVIGEPTGTSMKFASMMGQAVKQFFDEKGVDDLRLTLMPLEGEGTIDSRAYLSNPAWINDLRRADAIFFAAHSQGCIVTTHLISRMIAQGHIRTALNAEAVSRCEWAFGPIGVVPQEDPRKGRRYPIPIVGSEGGCQKVAMLAMCGVHLGPLYSISTSTVIQPYLQWFENAAARELFEFQESTSAVSVAYQKALSMVLENEVRVVLLASLNDQVVPIYGASFSTATHPLLLRALYVDGASYAQSDFMTKLLSFAFMLKNAGIDDQRLVEHLSEATAGSLTGIGHSTPYEELSCYSVAVHYLFHAGSARHPLSPLQVEPFSARDAKNDFELPWIMRALVDSPEIKDLFPGELKDLKEGILNWRPNTKVLKEIKKRLEPMAGRQSRLRGLHVSPSSASLNSNHDSSLGISPGGQRALASGKALKSRL
ncbi:uncharacterized protein IL334_006895 [Kwoniella shivajii]|uniref:YMC020W-like alpha/beta hydrolase domain-containing protein n=1 Tax=Kwoniella shivajii TaxID=564305 RepID=A0ABZ1D9F0_9TREE|nr:hypothetical protein IL334_006895 [Kwoniella shivajii]